jgi:hypothetical protein
MCRTSSFISEDHPPTFARYTLGRAEDSWADGSGKQQDSGQRLTG